MQKFNAIDFSILWFFAGNSSQYVKFISFPTWNVPEKCYAKFIWIFYAPGNADKYALDRAPDY